MWQGECFHRGLDGATATVHLAAAAIDDLLTKGPKEVVGSKLTIRLLASGSFGGPLDDESEWEIGAAPKEASGWLSLDWTLSLSHGSQRCLRCLLRARRSSDTNEMSLQILLPAEATGFAPRPDTPLGTKKAVREVRESGALLELERVEVSPTDSAREIRLGTSMHRAVCGLFKASLRVFEAAVAHPTTSAAAAASAPSSSSNSSNNNSNNYSNLTAMERAVEVEEMDREARERYGIVAIDKHDYTAPSSDTLCVRFWHLKAEIELPSDALWTLIRFRVLLHKLFKDWPFLLRPGPLRDEPAWLKEFLELEEEDQRMERIVTDGFEAFMGKLHSLGFTTCFVHGKHVPPSVLASSSSAIGGPVVATSAVAPHQSPPPERSCDDAPVVVVGCGDNAGTDSASLLPSNPPLPNPPLPMSDPTFVPIFAYSLSVGLNSLPQLRLDHFSQRRRTRRSRRSVSKEDEGGVEGHSSIGLKGTEAETEVPMLGGVPMMVGGGDNTAAAALDSRLDSRYKRMLSLALQRRRAKYETKARSSVGARRGRGRRGEKEIGAAATIPQSTTPDTTVVGEMPEGEVIAAAAETEAAIVEEKEKAAAMLRAARLFFFETDKLRREHLPEVQEEKNATISAVAGVSSSSSSSGGGRSRSYELAGRKLGTKYRSSGGDRGGGGGGSEDLHTFRLSRFCKGSGPNNNTLHNPVTTNTITASTATTTANTVNTVTTTVTASTAITTDVWIVDARGKRFWGAVPQWRQAASLSSRTRAEAGTSAGGAGCVKAKVGPSLSRLHPHPDSVPIRGPCAGGVNSGDGDKRSSSCSSSGSSSKSSSGRGGGSSSGGGSSDEALEAEMLALLQELSQNNPAHSRWADDSSHGGGGGGGSSPLDHHNSSRLTAELNGDGVLLVSPKAFLDRLRRGRKKHFRL